MKVLHGTMEISNQMSTLTRAMRAQGVEASCISYYRTYLGYQSDFEYPLAQTADPAQRSACSDPSCPG